MPHAIPTVLFDKGRATAQSSAKESLLIISENEDHLLEVRNGRKHIEAARNFRQMIERGEQLTPRQLSYVDGILEMCYKGAGHESVNLHVDKKRRSLKY